MKIPFIEYHSRRSAFALCVILYAGLIIWPASTARSSALAESRVNSNSHIRKAAEARRRRVAEAQEHLVALGFWVDPDSPARDQELHSAVEAFQKIEGVKVTGRLSESDLEALSDAKPPVPKEKGTPHVEVDLDRQVLFWVDAEGTVSKILPVSTGSGKEFTSEEWTRDAVTPTGRFLVSKKLDGWQRSPLGLLYYPSFIVGGIAIHGAPSVPAYPASHGCIRIPMFAAEEFSDMTPIGTVVIVYGTEAHHPETENNQ